MDRSWSSALTRKFLSVTVACAIRHKTDGVAELRLRNSAGTDGMTKPTTFAAIFDNREAAEGFVRRLAEENLGLSINVSSSLANGLGCCKSAGVVRHSVGYSLGFEGLPDNVPNRHAVMLATMCGHGMISQAFAKKMIDFVKEDRRTPEQAIAALGRFCSCGIFNPTRARRIIEDARTKAF